MLTGLLMSTWMPINKMIWTSSYAVFTSGLAFVVFACTYWLVDVQRLEPIHQAVRGIWIERPCDVRALRPVCANPGRDPHGRSVSSHVHLAQYLRAHRSGSRSILLFAVSHSLLFLAVAYWFYKRNWIIRV